MIARTLAGLTACATLAGCAALDQYAVGETHRLDRVPYYRTLVKGEKPAPGSVIVLPVTLQREMRDSFMYGDRAGEFAPLLAALNARLSAARECCRAVESTPAGEAPQVYIGIAGGDLAPAETEDQRLETDRFAPMVLHLDRPDPAWRDGLASLAGEHGARYTLQISLGVSQYNKGRQGFVRKQVVLGSGHVQPVKFLTAEDKPMEVLHLTGVLLDENGRAVRAGAEGIIARDTPFRLQIFDVSKVLDDLDLAAALEERRMDLPGEPHKWQVALDNLIAQLTFGNVIVPAEEG